MALTSLADLSIIDANNTSFSGITQAENSMKPSDVNDDFRATDGSIARYLSDLAGINQTVGGTANVITVTVAQTWTALANGQRMAIKNTVGPNTGATTISVTNSVAGALGTKAIRLQGDSALVGGEMLANGIYEFRYDTSYNAAAGAWVLLNPAVSSSNLTSNASFINLSLVASVAASALTVAIKGVDGNDPSASNPVIISFRSATAGSGAVAQLTLTAATSIVISSGSTMGFTSAVIGKLWLVGFNDAGTFRLGLVNCLSGTSIMALRDGIYSSTAEGGAGAADSAQVIYSGTAVTSKAMTILGYLEATEATAGTWATAPSLVQVRTPSTALPGDRVQRFVSQDGTTATGTTVVPSDNTIPQNTEGTQFMSQAITPASAGNVLRISHLGEYTATSTGRITAALFQDATANALAASGALIALTDEMVLVSLDYSMKAGTGSSTTFKIRTGNAAASTTRFNGFSGAQVYGGVSNSSLVIEEMVA